MIDGLGPQGSGAQEVRFCRSRDGVRLAYARHGSGPPLVISSCWLSHLEYDWQSPVWRHFLADLGAVSTMYRYDERGFGLSDWDVEDFSYQARLADLELLLDEIGLERFALMGMSGGAPVAIGYAARHPERVSRLILYGSIGSGCFGETGDEATEEALLALIRAGWARPDPIFRRVFTSTLIPEATEQQMAWLDELQRMSTSTRNAVATRIVRRQVDVTSELPRVTAPTLVLHARGDRAAPYAWGREFSARIPDARLVPMESSNHILLADEPAWPEFLREVSGFLAADAEPAASGMPLPPLTAREREILERAAVGRDNQQIAGDLHLSVRTVERHLQNVYLKLGVSGRSARAAAVGAVLAARR